MSRRIELARVDAVTVTSGSRATEWEITRTGYGDPDVLRLNTDEMKSLLAQYRALGGNG